MKKVILIIMLILMIPVVKAKDLLEYDLDWESKIYDSPVANTYEYKDGYLFGDYGHDLSFNLSYYDKQGNFKKEIKIDDLVMLVYPEEYIYVLSGRYTNTTISFVLQAYNENLELVNEVVVFTEDNDGVSIYDHPDYILYDLVNNRFVDMYKELITKDYILIPSIKENVDPNSNPDNPNSIIEVRKYTKDLSSYEVLEFEQAKQMLEDIDEIVNPSSSDFRQEYGILDREEVKEYIIKDNLTALIVYDYGNDVGNSLKVYENKKLLYSKPLGEGLQLVNSKEVNIVDNHVMVIYYHSPDEYEWLSVLEIYNIKTGELEKRIESTSSLFSIVDTKRGFLYHETNCEYYLPVLTSNNPSHVLPTFIKQKACGTKRYVYSNYNAVIPKITTGKGTIIVDDKYAANDQVTVTIKPDKGYTLGTVKVIDAEGNVLTFTNNTFTMPASDVTIEVEFLVDNAKTSDIAITTVILLCILSIIVFFTQRKNIIKE